MQANKARAATVPALAAEGSALATEVVAAVGNHKLLDIKFWIEPAGATRDEILGAARDWIIGAERVIKQQKTAP